ncbi:hypothetical protein [Kitasatospora sp. NBC_00315]|uniref:hypothetical protein n=1 Tax=Kitasatospora sp. NBC_00315 TaxID=2975963 RepID=UPI00324AD67E
MLGQLSEMGRRQFRPAGFLVVEPGTRREVRHHYLAVPRAADLHDLQHRLVGARHRGWPCCSTKAADPWGKGRVRHAEFYPVKNRTA